MDADRAMDIESKAGDDEDGMFRPCRRDGTARKADVRRNEDRYGRASPRNTVVDDAGEG